MNRFMIPTGIFLLATACVLADPPSPQPRYWAGVRDERSGTVTLIDAATLLVVTGCGTMVQMTAANTLIQTMVDEDTRGRVMSFFGMAFQGTAPFRGLLAGWLAGAVGVRAVVFGSGVLVLLGGLAFATQLPRLRRHARPVYARLGILPEAAIGVQAASELPPLGKG